MLSEQEVALKKIDAETEIAARELRLAQVRKEIAQTELEIISLQSNLRNLLGGE